MVCVLQSMALRSLFGLPWWLSGKKNPPADAVDADSIPGLGRSPGEGNGNPLQFSYLGNPRTKEPGRLWYTGVAEELDTI